MTHWLEKKIDLLCKQDKYRLLRIIFYENTPKMYLTGCINFYHNYMLQKMFEIIYENLLKWSQE